ncbi:MAG TPA: CpaD family pilus assembly lipoprotein [Aliidongia sp.]|nr:CpaD family pilus assembly lipoprotein [Aliidongia sp.]
MRAPMIALVPILLLALDGCIASDATQYSAVEAPKAIRVDYARRTLDVGFEPGRATMTEAEAVKLQSFLAAGGLDDSDRVSLGAAPDDKLAQARLRELTLLLRGYGIVVRPDGAPAGLPRPGHVTVELARYVVTPPACPQWSRIARADFTTTSASNFGCADATNLALQVADPGDLLAGRGHGAFDGGPASAAIQRYRADKITPLIDTGVSPIAGGQAGAPPSTGGGSGSTP